MTSLYPAVNEVRTTHNWRAVQTGIWFVVDESEPDLPLCEGVAGDVAHLIAAAPVLLDAARLAMEGIEVIDLLIASIEKHGNYSVESTLGFLNQARCARLRLAEAIASAESSS